VQAMATPLIELIRKSGLIEPPKLEEYLQSIASELTGDSVHDAELFVRDGLLTRFQTKLLLQGKHRGFILHNKYKLLDLLGAGGMGKVFLCEHIMLKRLVAVKVLAAERMSDRSVVDRFYREARAVAALDHPNIVRLYDVQPDDKMPLMVIEYVDGQNLKTLVETSGPLDPSRAAHCIAQAAMGLQHAHENGLIHRDIKPANLLLDRNGVIKILDMGLARFQYDKNDQLTANYNDKSVMGTADYIAPEQAMNLSQADIRADIYSLGGTFYFLLTGQPPFGGNSVAQKLLAHQVKPVPSLRMVRADVPAELDAIFQRMMAKSPNDRFQQPIEVAVAMSQFARQGGYTIQEPTRPGSRTIDIGNLNRSSSNNSSLVQSSLDSLSGSFVSPTTSTGSSLNTPLASTANLSHLAVSTPALTPAGKSNLLYIGIGVGIAVLLVVVGMVGTIFLMNRGAAPEQPTTQSLIKTSPGNTANAKAKSKANELDDDLPLAGTITVDKVRDYYDRKVTVEFTIGSTGASGSRSFINSKENYKDPDNFTIVITNEIWKAGPHNAVSVKEYFKAGDRISVTGTIVKYNDRPQIELKSADLIRKLTD
jgi:serine/threonine protein kinase